MKLPCSKRFLVTRLILHQAIGCFTSILSRCFLSLCWQEDAMWMLSEIQCLKLFSIIIVGDIFKHNTVTFLDRVRSFRRNNNSEVLDKLFFPQQFRNDFKEDDSRTIVKKSPVIQSSPWVVGYQGKAFILTNCHKREDGVAAKQHFSHSCLGMYHGLGLGKQYRRRRKNRGLLSHQ